MNNSPYYWLAEADRLVELIQNNPEEKEELQKKLNEAIAKAVEHAFI